MLLLTIWRVIAIHHLIMHEMIPSFLDLILLIIVCSMSLLLHACIILIDLFHLVPQRSYLNEEIFRATHGRLVLLLRILCGTLEPFRALGRVVAPHLAIVTLDVLDALHSLRILHHNLIDLLLRLFLLLTVRGLMAVLAAAEADHVIVMPRRSPFLRPGIAVGELGELKV